MTRDGLDTQRQAATATLVGLQAQRAALAGERVRIEASTGPMQYLALMVGAAPEAAVRWLILLMVLLLRSRGNRADRGGERLTTLEH